RRPARPHWLGPTIVDAIQVSTHPQPQQSPALEDVGKVRPASGRLAPCACGQTRDRLQPVPRWPSLDRGGGVTARNRSTVAYRGRPGICLKITVSAVRFCPGPPVLTRLAPPISGASWVHQPSGAEESRSDLRGIALPGEGVLMDVHRHARA